MFLEECGDLKREDIYHLKFYNYLEDKQRIHESCFMVK